MFVQIYDLIHELFYFTGFIFSPALFQNFVRSNSSYVGFRLAFNFVFNEFTAENVKPLIEQLIIIIFTSPSYSQF